ncbi:flagellin [Selenomonas sp. KH1T6]|uniref:flagellin n=1 Tax=Selenomonas sp. KH1T6 TaxID=3158784 RepID=UPI0039B7008B
MTNQSFHEDTDGATKLVDLQNRNGERLNIQTTDTLTISYVIQGRNYSVDIDIDGNTTLDSALVEASEAYTRNSPAAASAYAAYDSSNAQANSTYWSSYNQASTVYTSTVNNVTISVNGNTQNALSAMNSASVVAASSYSVYKDYYNWFSNATGPGGVQLYPTETDIQNAIAATPVASTALSNYNNASTVYNNASTQYNSTVGVASAILASAVNSATAVRNSSWSSASTVLSVALSTAASTLGDAVGELIPYKLGVDASDVVGKAASGDTVYTANREKAITITSGSAGTRFQISGITFSVKDSQGKVKKSVNAVLDDFNETVRAVNKSNDNAITLQVGTKANQSIRIGLTDMRTEALGLKASTGETISVATQKDANAAINVLDNALQKALNQQTDIGAVQARLEMTSANLVLSSQNVQASESTIRDADMAKEMTEYTKNNVLLQAAQSMLAQANQSSSSVLSLLQ